MDETDDLTPQGNASEEDLALYETAKQQMELLDTSGSFDPNVPNQRLYTPSASLRLNLVIR